MSKTNALRRLKKALDNKYETQQATPTAGAVGDGKLFISGQLYDGALSGVAQVVNTGRPAAAQYAAKAGGQVIVRSSGGGGTTTGGSSTDVTALSLLTVVAESALTNDRYLDVATGLTKTDGGAGAALTLGLNTPGTLTVSSTSVATGNHTHAITSSSAPGAAASLLASSAAGLLTLPNFTATAGVRTPLIDTASGALTLQPAGTNVVNVNTLLTGGFGARATSGTLDWNDATNARPGSGHSLLLSNATNGPSAAGSRYYHPFSFEYATKDGTGVLTQFAVPYGYSTGIDGGLHMRGRYLGTWTNWVKLISENTSGNVLIGTYTDGGYKLDVTGTARITTSLTTPLLTTASNVDLVINPAGTGAVQFPNDQTLRTTSFDSSFPINGWQINEVAGVSGYSALTIGKIQADELAVRVFVADEVRVDRGDEFWTKSYGIVAATFTTPSTIGSTVSVMFEDSPALAGAIFVNNDWVLIRKLDIDTGITLSNIWGQVATYVNNSDGTQNWTFTLRSGPTSESVTKGSLAIDFGASGAALIHLSVIDAAGAPYIKMRKWAGANPYTPANFTTYVQLGHLGSTGNAYVTPAGFGLYARSTNDASRFILSDDNGLQIRGAAFKMYNSTLQTVDISATNGSVKLGTDISSGATTALDFNASTGDLAITGDLYTADVYLTRVKGILLNTGATDDYVSGYNTKSIQWFSDITNPTENALVTLAGAKATNDVYANLSAYSSAGIAKVRLIADSDVASTTDSQMYLRSQTGGNSVIYMFSDTISLQGVNGVTSSAISVSGDITVSGNVDGVDIAAFKSAYDSHNHNSTYLALSGGTLTGTLTSRAITPSADNTYDLGAPGARWQDLYAVNLHVSTIVGTPSYSHSHAASDITSGTLDFARIPTTWTGALTLDADSAGTSNYVRWTTQTGAKNWDLTGRAHDYATVAQQNDLLLTYYDGTTIYTAFHADSATRIIDFGQTPTVGGTAVVLASRTVSAGSGLTDGGALSSDITLSHADTSTQASVNNSGMTFIQDVTLDTYGHVTALTSTDVSSVLTGYVKTDGTTTGATSQAQAFTNGVQTGFGSAAAPGLSFVSDTDTGIIRSAANKLGFVTNATEWATLDSAGLLTVNEVLTAGWVKNSLIGIAGTGAGDVSMLGLYDRNELLNADLRGTVTITITGAGSVTTSTINNAFNARGDYMTITGTDNTTTQILIHIDLGTNQPNYGSALWQPFLQYRLGMNGSFTHYRTIVCEVSTDSTNWYKPAAGWETTTPHTDEVVPGLWMGSNALPPVPGNVYRYVRFTLTDRFENAGYASKASVWISQIGLRHYASPFSRAWLYASGDTMYGAMVVKTSNAAAFDVQNGSGTSLLKANTSATTVYVTGDLDVSDNVLLASGSASLPPLAGSADTNTGLYWSAADTLAITTGGTQRATFSGTGLSVTGTLVVSSTASIGDGSTTTPGLNFGADANTGIYRSGEDAFSMVAGGTAIINIGATGASVNAAFDNTAALKVQSVANDDITLFLKQKSGQTARMWRVEDSAGQELIVLDSQGNLQSGNPGFYNGLTGWQITPNGNAEFNNITARGELHASIFVMDEFHASGGTLVVAPAGKLENDATVYTTNGVSQVIDLRTTSVSGSGSQLDIRTTSGSGSGTQLTVRWIQNYFDITDPPSGHAMVFSFGDTLRCKSLGDPGVGIDLYDIWGTVTLVEDMTDYYRYYYQRRSGGSNGIVIPAGTAIISYGAEGDGRILLTADQNYAPYIDIFTSGATPWTGDVVPHTRLGRLDGVGLPGVSGIEQYGMVTSTDLSDATAPYIINSNLQMFSYNVDSEWNNGNPTARITSGGVFKLGTDIDSATTTGLDFNPQTGALTIGNASYPGSVTVYGTITVEGGSSGYANFSDRPTTLNSINASEYTKINSGLDASGNLITKVLPGSTVGTPGGAGLFLGSDKMGYYNGSRWLTYMDNTGAFTFSSATSAKLAWDGTDLYGTDGTNTQWYARASTGKFYAGNGAVVLDRTGILVANDGTSAGITLHRTNAFSSSTKSGRLWALSDLSPARVYFSAGRSVSNDGDASSAAGIMDIVAYNSSGTATAMLSLNGSSSTINVTGDLDMGGNDIIDANNVISIRTTA